MAKGDGSIRQSRDKHGKPIPNSWEVCIYTGYNPVTRSYGRSYKTIHGTKTEARRVRDEMRFAISTGLRSDADKVLFGVFSTEWLEGRKASGSLSTATKKNYTYAVAMLNGYLADAPITSITAATVDALYNIIRKERGISCTTLRKVHTVLNQIMKRAMRYDLIMRNPCERIDVPRCEKVSRRSLTKEEGQTLQSSLSLALAKAYADYENKERRQEYHGNAQGRTYIRDIQPIACVLAARFCLSTGARRGEVLGMVWGALNQSGVASIKQSLVVGNEIRAPKTSAGIRKVSIDEATFAVLMDWKEYQAAQLEKIGIRQTNSTPIFSNSKGEYIRPENFSRWWRGFTDKIGFKGLKFHELRHTQATQLLANSVDIKTVQTRLGHASASITLNLYAHALPENDRNAAALIGELFGEVEQEERPTEHARTA